MYSHKNARLTRLGRAHLMQQIAKVGLKAAADQAGISVRRAHIWHKRWKEAGQDGLSDHSSRPHSSPRQTSPDKHKRIVRLHRNHRLPYPEIAHPRVSRPQRWGASVRVRGWPGCRLPKPHSPSAATSGKRPANCCSGYQKAGTLRPPRPPRDPRPDTILPRAGYHALHVAIDDHSRVGFSLILPDETARSAITFTLAALRYYRALDLKITGIMTDNGSAYRSRKFAKLLRRLGIRHLRTRPCTRPYTPRTNGKAERFDIHAFSARIMLDAARRLPVSRPGAYLYSVRIFGADMRGGQPAFSCGRYGEGARHVP